MRKDWYFQSCQRRGKEKEELTDHDYAGEKGAIAATLSRTSKQFTE